MLCDRNWFWAEYVQCYNDHIESLKGGLDGIRNSLAGHSAEITGRADYFLEKCRELGDYVEAVEAGKHNEQLLSTLREKFVEAREGVAYLALAASQKFPEWHDTMVLGKDVGRQEYHDALNKFFRASFEAIYGSSKDSLEPSVLTWCEYKSLWHLRLITIPCTDLELCHHFTPIPHEIFHWKMNDVVDCREKIGNREPNTIDVQVKLQKLIRSYNEEKGARFDQMVTNVVTQIMASTDEIYKKIALDQFQRGLIVPMDWFGLQVIEICCDCASVLLSGPADLFSSVMEWADYFRYSQLGLTMHISSLTHPPEYVRLRYMLQMLKRMGIPEKEMDSWQNRLSELLIPSENNNTDPLELYRKYEEAVLIYLDDIMEIVSWLIQQEHLFSGEDWRQAKDVYALLAQGHPLSKGISPFVLLNVAWLKRIDLYRQTCEKTGDLNAFKEALRNSKPFFKRITQALA